MKKSIRKSSVTPQIRPRLTSKKFTISVDRLMWKGYLADIVVTAKIDQFQMDVYAEERSVVYGRSDYPPSEIKDDIMLDIESVIESFSISRDGDIRINQLDPKYYFVDIVIMSNGREIGSISDIDSWEYDEGEVSILEEKYKIIRGF